MTSRANVNIVASDRGESWEGNAAAARAVGYSPSAVSAALVARSPLAGRQLFAVPLGWHWQLDALLRSLRPAVVTRSRPAGRKSYW